MRPNEKEKASTEILQLYNNEIYNRSSIDLGVNGATRAKLRENVKQKLLNATTSTLVKKANSHISGNSSSIHDYEGNAMSVLKKLQRERMIITRLGFTEKAEKLDEQIEKTRKAALEQRNKEQEELIREHLTVLEKKQERKLDRLNALLSSKKRELEKRLEAEYKNLLDKQEQEFVNMFQNTEKKAIGKISKCNCTNSYLCRHNESSSYNTRKPQPQVVLYKKSSKRLKQGGRSEDAVELENLALELDQQHQEAWRKHVSNSIVCSPWGANVSVMDRMIENNKKQIKIMEEAHACKRKEYEVSAERRRWALQNNMNSEKNRLRNKCRKIYENLLVQRTKLENVGEDDDAEIDDVIVAEIDDAIDTEIEKNEILESPPHEYGNQSAHNIIQKIQNTIVQANQLKSQIRILLPKQKSTLETNELPIISNSFIVKSIMKNKADDTKRITQRSISFSVDIVSDMSSSHYIAPTPPTSLQSSANTSSANTSHRKLSEKPLKPGSLRDEDWIEKEKEIGNGFVNSYGVSIE